MNLGQSQEEKQVVERMQSSLSDLELVLAKRRYGGRPKGRKVSQDDTENIRKWMAGDRTWERGSSAKDVAKRLKVSRQTVYTIQEELRLKEDEKLMTLGNAVLTARDMLKKNDVSPEEIRPFLNWPFDAKEFMSDKEIFINIAKQYQQSQSSSSLDANG